MSHISRHTFLAYIHIESSLSASLVEIYISSLFLCSFLFDVKMETPLLGEQHNTKKYFTHSKYRIYNIGQNGRKKKFIFFRVEMFTTLKKHRVEVNVTTYIHLPTHPIFWFSSFTYLHTRHSLTYFVIRVKCFDAEKHIFVCKPFHALAQSWHFLCFPFSHSY